MRSGPAGDFDYDRAGAAYATVRRPDPRIAARVHAALGDAATVLNVGAGAGSYEPADRDVTAVEPSAAMRSQRPPGSPPAIDAVAEDLPFEDGAFDAATAMITVHQWPDPTAGLAELRRVTRGPVAVLTFDGTQLDRLWLGEYCPELHAAESRRYPDVRAILDALGGTGSIDEVAIPLDCVDGFTEAFYGRPERFLDPAVRACQSAWGFVEPQAAARGIARLESDLRSGRWDECFGHLRSQDEFVGALRLIASYPEPAR